MTSVVTSSTSLSAKTPSGAMGNALSALTAVLNAAGVSNSAFSSLLAQVDTSDPTAALSKLAAQIRMQNADRGTTVTVTQQGPTSASRRGAAAAAATPVLKPSHTSDDQKPTKKTQKQDVTDNHSDTSQGNKASTSAKQSTRSSDDNSPTTPVSSTSQNTSNDVTTPADTAPQTAPAPLPSTVAISTDVTADPSIDLATDTLTDADIIQMMQDLMRQLQKNPVTNAGNANGTSATAQGDDAGVGSIAGAGTKKTDLEALLDALKGKTGDSTSTDPTTDQNAASDASSDGEASASTPAASSSVASNAHSTLLTSSLVPAAGVDTNPLVPAFDFQNFLKAVAPAPSATPPAFVPLAANDQVAASAGQDGASLNADLDSQNNNSATLLRDLAPGATSTTGSTASGAARAANPYSFASQLTALHATTTSVAASAVDQVVLHLNRSAKDGSNQMTLQLHPADLGQVTIKLDIASDGKVHGFVTADNQSTLNMLAKDSRSLERSLQDAGLQADPGSLQFSMSGQSENGSGRSGNAFSSQTGTGTMLPVADAAADLAASTTVAETYYLTPNGVNLSV